MAKVSFNKLGLKVNSQVETVDFNGETIEVKQYIFTLQDNNYI